MREDDAFGLARRPAGGHDDRIALLDGERPRQDVVLAVRCHHPGRAEGGQDGVPGGAGQAGVERGGGVAHVPHRAQRVDETGSSGKVECDEFRHWPVA